MFILIGGDLVPTKSNINLFISGDARGLLGRELKATLDNSCFRIFNLEVPLTNEYKPIVKNGPNLIAATSSVSGYKALKIDLLTLANNHILDQGEQGLYDTIKTLNKAGINHIGAGRDLTIASKPFVFEFAGKRIGVYACAEHEFSVATDNTPGANPYDPLWSFDHVSHLKTETDYVIVLYHGGKEHYRYPSPNLQKICRRFVDKGANLVVCQHSHCIGCEEKYMGGTIVYGQGNFLFDNCDDEFWKTGILIKIDDEYLISFIPIIKDKNVVRLADGQEGEKILNEFYQRSQEILEPNTVEEKYDVFASLMKDFYLSHLSGKKTMVFRAANRITSGLLLRGYLKRKYNNTSLVSIANYINCEAHRELLLQALSKEYKSIM